MYPVEVFRATLNKSVSIFRKYQIRFHLTGGITSVFYGEPRMTQDVDIVVDNAQVAGVLEPFLETLHSSDFIYDSDAIRIAVKERGMFQLLDGVESLKLDIYARELIPGELDRSEMVEIFDDENLPVASRADSAVSKLIWISKGSHKSRHDLRHIFRTSGQPDRNLILHMADQLNLSLLLVEVLNEPDEIE